MTVAHFLHDAFILFLLLLPEERDLLVVTLAYGALIRVAHALLGPKGAFLLHVDLEGREVGLVLKKYE